MNSKMRAPARPPGLRAEDLPQPSESDWAREQSERWSDWPLSAERSWARLRHRELAERVAPIPVRSCLQPAAAMNSALLGFAQARWLWAED